MLLIATFMFEPAKLQTNCARARGINMLLGETAEPRSVASSVIAALLDIHGRRRALAGFLHLLPGGAVLYEARVSGYEIHPPRSPIELAVEVDGGIDQGQVREGLWEVAQLFAGRADLFGEEPNMVPVRQHLLERESSLLESAG